MEEDQGNDGATSFDIAFENERYDSVTGTRKRRRPPDELAGRPRSIPRGAFSDCESDGETTTHRS